MDPGYLLLQQFQKHGLTLLNQWVKESVREDLHMDFKRKHNPNSWKLSPDDKRNFSRALSGFANSDGGIIVWGVDAPGSGESIRAKHPITPVKGFAENLDSQISRAVNPAVNGVINHIIFEDELQDLGYVITYVPKSLSSPHRAEYEGLKQYYKRYGESFKIVEHYELEYMFGKRHYPEISLFWSLDLDLPFSSPLPPVVPATLRLGITNQGKAIATYVCLRVRYQEGGPFVLSPDQKGDLIHYSPPMKASRYQFTIITARALQGLVVYPGDYTFFFNFSVKIPKEELDQGKAPKFEVYYDLMAEDFRGITNEQLSISGRKIAEKIKKKAETIQS